MNKLAWRRDRAPRTILSNAEILRVMGGTNGWHKLQAEQAALPAHEDVIAGRGAVAD